jgi:hypothetical protein
MEVIFGSKPDLVAATMSNRLGQELTQVAGRAQAVRQWAGTAQCPLPVEFESGSSVVTELLNTAAANARLKQFADEWSRLNQFAEQLQALEEFRRDHGPKYPELRDFFTGMVNAETNLPAVTSFIQDWLSVTNARTVWQPARWNEVCLSYERARQAVTDQIAAWRSEADRGVTELQGSVSDRVQAMGVSDDQMAEEMSALVECVVPIKDLLTQPALSYATARGLAGELLAAQYMSQRRLAEVKAKYDPEAKPTHLTWSQVAGRVELRAPEDVEPVLNRLRTVLRERLSEGGTIILD